MIKFAMVHVVVMVWFVLLTGSVLKMVNVDPVSLWMMKPVDAEDVRMLVLSVMMEYVNFQAYVLCVRFGMIIQQPVKVVRI
jgi:hypothetical protein